MIKAHPKYFLLAMTFMLMLASFTSLLTGALNIPASHFFDVLMSFFGIANTGNVEAYSKMAILEFRLPRLLLALLVGAALSISGTAIQGLFRNPLADPGLIGVSSGSAFGAVAVIVLGDRLLTHFNMESSRWLLPLAAFACGFFVTLIIYRIATRSGTTQVATLLLAGIAINAIAGAGTGLLTFLADDTQLRNLTFWSMGSLARASWADIGIVTPFILFPVLLLPLFSKALNGFLMGESVAVHLGFSIHWVKRGIIFLTAMAVGAAVSMTGVIGFLGLVIPHLLRGVLGPDHRILLPASALSGALLLTIADMLARTIVAPAELPIGLIMALIGGPFFLSLLLKSTPVSQRLP